MYYDSAFWSFWNFWGPVIFFTTLLFFAVLFGVLAVRLRETAAATASEVISRSTWSLATIVWFGWTEPRAEAAFDYALNLAYISNIFDPTEVVLRAFSMPTGAAGLLDWYFLACGILMTATLLDVVVFHRLHRKEMTRLVARSLSGTVTVLTVLPVWLMYMLVVIPLVGVWHSMM